MHSFRWYAVVGSIAFVLVGCAPTMSGTHVELIAEGGRTAYVSGAAAPGIAQGVACPAAINRAVAALAQRFAYEQKNLADAVAKAAKVSDGAAFLQMYAKEDAQKAAVQDVSYDPSQHLCMVTVRWQPPLFLEEATTRYAESLRAQADAPAAPASAPLPASVASPTQAPQPPPPAPAVTTVPPPAPAADVAPPPAATSQASVTLCPGARSAFEASSRAGDKALTDYRECLRRTHDDANVCYRYGLYVEQAKEKNAAAAQSWADCVNRDLPMAVRQTLQHDLPGHGAKIVETRANGGLVAWTFAPAEGTSFAVEFSANATITHRDALPANQAVWLHQQLGM